VAEDKAKLLIVEDDLGLQKQLKWCFNDYEVIVAADRAAAIAALRRHEPAVVLQDLGLPPDAEGVAEGFACLLEALKLAPHTKVIVVTGQLDKQNAVRAVVSAPTIFTRSPSTPTCCGCSCSVRSTSTRSRSRTGACGNTRAICRSPESSRSATR